MFLLSAKGVVLVNILDSFCCSYLIISFSLSFPMSLLLLLLLIMYLSIVTLSSMNEFQSNLVYQFFLFPFAFPLVALESNLLTDTLPSIIIFIIVRTISAILTLHFIFLHLSPRFYLRCFPTVRVRNLSSLIFAWPKVISHF